MLNFVPVLSLKTLFTTVNRYFQFLSVARLFYHNADKHAQGANSDHSNRQTYLLGIVEKLPKVYLDIMSVQVSVSSMWNCVIFSSTNGGMVRRELTDGPDGLRRLLNIKTQATE